MKKPIAYWLLFDRTLMAASMDLQAASARPGKPEQLFNAGAGFEPAPNSRRFLVPQAQGGAPADLPMVVVRNWAARLEKAP